MLTSPRFNKMQSVQRDACWFLCSTVIAHELQGVTALGSSSKNIFPWQLFLKKWMLHYEEWRLIDQFCFRKPGYSQVYSRANWNSLIHFSSSEMHKQGRHLPLSKQGLMLHHCKSVSLVNIPLKYDGWYVDNIKSRPLPKPEILHIQRQPVRCSRQPTADALLLDAYQLQDVAAS